MVIGKGTETGPWKAGGTKIGQIPLWLFLHLENIHVSQYLSCKRRSATLAPPLRLARATPSIFVESSPCMSPRFVFCDEYLETVRLGSVAGSTETLRRGRKHVPIAPES